MFQRIIALGLLLCVATGCALSADARRKIYVNQTKNLTPEVEAAVREGALLEGMDTGAVSASWGEPGKIDRNHNNDLSLTRWEWGSRSVTAAGIEVTPNRWALFKDGKLVKWEDNRSASGGQ